MQGAKQTSLLRVLVSSLTGLSLFLLAWAGAGAAISHALQGNPSGALITGSIGFAAFLTCLLFLMPSALRKFIDLGRRPHSRGPIRVGAFIVLLALLFSCAVVRGPLEFLSFGFLPRSAFVVVMLIHAILFCVVFIYPGLAYATDVKVKPPRTVAPKPQIILGNEHLSPAVRRAVQAFTYIYGLLGILACYADSYASVIPDPGIIDVNRKFLVLSTLVLSLPFGILVATRPITHGQTWRDHLRVKWSAMLGLAAISGFICWVVPERGMPVLANAVFETKSETRSYRVISATPASGKNFCATKVVIALDPETGRNFDLCRIPVSIAERAKPGDTLYIHGATAGSGLTVEGITLLSAPGNTTPDAVPIP